MENNKKEWSWWGFFFNIYYYAGYGNLKKAIILTLIYFIPLIGWLITMIYSGAKANEDLPIKKIPFSWIKVFIILVFISVYILLDFSQRTLSTYYTTGITSSVTKIYAKNSIDFTSDCVRVFSISDPTSSQKYIQNFCTCLNNEVTKQLNKESQKGIAKYFENAGYIKNAQAFGFMMASKASNSEDKEKLNILYQECTK